MTVCIAAISYENQRIVTASDFMLSTNWASLDTRTQKFWPLCSSGRWVAMFAGDPTVDAHVVKAAYELLEGRGETSEEVVNAVEGAFRAELKRKIEGELLSPYGLDRDTFLAKGLVYFGDQHFNYLINKIASVTLDTSFLIAGYEPDTVAPKLIVVEDPGIHTYYNGVGFCAIGTGQIQALGSLYNTYDSILSRDDLIYRVCEAKFLSELALGVGKRTVILTIAPDGSYEALFPNLVEPIREVWERQGRPPVPQDACAIIKNSVHPVKWPPRQ